MKKKKNLSTSLSSSENELESISERMKRLLGGQPVSVFARKADIGESLMRQYLAGTTPGTDKLIKIARAGNVSIEWLATGEGPMRPGETGELDRDEYAYIPMVNVKLSAGGGFEVLEEKVVEKYAFKRKWMGKMGLNSHNAVLMSVSGDSMQPTLFDGDVVMIDTARKNIEPGRLSAIRLDNTAAIKRLDLLSGGKVRIISDNNIYKDYEARRDDVHVLGQVVWFAREMS